MPRPVGSLFLSHSSDDVELTQRFGELLRNLSLGQIEIWFSSDGESTGGIRPGDIWFEKIREKMKASSSIVVLLTPQSIDSKWVLFEAGAGAALDNGKLMVVTHGVETMKDLPGPLAFWQAHRIDKAEGISVFCKKLFALYDVEFNVRLFDSYLPDFTKAVTTKRPATLSSTAVARPDATVEISSLLIEHFDRRFFELASELNVQSQYITYKISVISEFDDKTYQVEISEDMSIQDTLNEIYDAVSDYVRAYRYLHTWILVHQPSGLKLVIREIASEIPAKILFKPSATWIARKLEEPYKPGDSKPEAMSKLINK